jgi:hypothetical protein
LLLLPGLCALMASAALVFKIPYVGGYGTITGISLVIAWYA